MMQGGAFRFPSFFPTRFTPVTSAPPRPPRLGAPSRCSSPPLSKRTSPNTTSVPGPFRACRSLTKASFKLSRGACSRPALELFSRGTLELFSRTTLELFSLPPLEPFAVWDEPSAPCCTAAAPAEDIESTEPPPPPFPIGCPKSAGGAPWEPGFGDDGVRIAGSDSGLMTSLVSLMRMAIGGSSLREGSGDAPSRSAPSSVSPTPSGPELSDLRTTVMRSVAVPNASIVPCRGSTETEMSCASSGGMIGSTWKGSGAPQRFEIESVVSSGASAAVSDNRSRSAASVFPWIRQPRTVMDSEGNETDWMVIFPRVICFRSRPDGTRKTSSRPLQRTAICMVWVRASEKECTCVEVDDESRSTVIIAAMLASGSKNACSSTGSSERFVTVNSSLHLASGGDGSSISGRSSMNPPPEELSESWRPLKRRSVDEMTCAEREKRRKLSGLKTFVNVTVQLHTPSPRSRGPLSPPSNATGTAGWITPSTLPTAKGSTRATGS
mmetsp:Transcript_20570/g.46342  ORF Transcript_20570/g.46342 Transcript_20570/m.46342 type:complete len:495 (-) Transcript_20570:617-2101(-)